MTKRRVIEITETIASLTERITILQKELKDIQWHCKHPDKYLTPTVCGRRYSCDDCGDSWWD